MTDRELMQQALEALEWNLPVIEDYGDHEQLNRQHRAIIALRERLAQPEPPVLTGIDCSCGKKWRIFNNTLTASEPETVMAEYKFQTYAAYKTDGGEMKIGVVLDDAPLMLNGVPLYPRREWVGLTDEEYSQLHDGFHQQGKLLGWVVDQVEAKLKEKNT